LGAISQQTARPRQVLRGMVVGKVRDLCSICNNRFDYNGCVSTTAKRRAPVTRIPKGWALGIPACIRHIDNPYLFCAIGFSRDCVWSSLFFQKDVPQNLGTADSSSQKVFVSVNKTNSFIG